MKFLKNLLVVFAFCFLQACALNKPQLVKEVQTVVIAPPEALLIVPVYLQPPARNVYMAAPWSAKEELLVGYSLALMLSLSSCTNNFESLKEWKKGQLEIYGGIKK